jgi:hypothetical protein
VSSICVDGLSAKQRLQTGAGDRWVWGPASHVLSQVNDTIVRTHKVCGDNVAAVLHGREPSEARC